MKNIKTDNRETIFLDLDGSLCFHNYELTEDILLPGTIDYLRSLKEKNYYCVLTTGRTKEMCINILNQLKITINFEFDQCLFDLPTGKRTVLNDTTDLNQPKALAISVLRNTGFKESE